MTYMYTYLTKRKEKKWKFDQSINMYIKIESRRTDRNPPCLFYTRPSLNRTPQAIDTCKQNQPPFWYPSTPSAGSNLAITVEHLHRLVEQDRPRRL